MNPSALTLLVLQFGFLVVLWVFVFAVAYALRSDLFGHKVRKLPPNPAPAATPVPPRPSPVNQWPEPAPAAPETSENPHSERARRLVILSGARAGTELELGDEPVTIGRSSESSLVIRDEYTSTHHARLMLWNDVWMLHDLDSTNGTYLDGRRVTVPTPVPLGKPIKVGQTTFELRR